ncbi:MAG: hypothetical protein ABWY56_14895, partial [Propionibacteriaceae bacterium]
MSVAMSARNFEPEMFESSAFESRAFEQGDTLEQVLAFDEDETSDGPDPAEAATDTQGSRVQELFSEAKLANTLAVVVRLAQQVLPCDGVGVLLTDEGGAMAPAAASDRAAAWADALQVSTHQGPGFQGVCRRQPVIASDLRTDSR